MRLANNLHVREDKVATARKTGGKPKLHREFHRDYFRGGNAPASLKPGCNGPRKTGIGPFPGWKRPGLIEAVIVAMSETIVIGFPGWKRPGLIEAIQSRVYQLRA